MGWPWDSMATQTLRGHAQACRMYAMLRCLMEMLSAAMTVRYPACVTEQGVPRYIITRQNLRIRAGSLGQPHRSPTELCGRCVTPSWM